MLLVFRLRQHLPQTLQSESLLKLFDADSQFGAVNRFPVLPLEAAVSQVRSKHVRGIWVASVYLVDIVYCLNRG
jgi:hypothetical protein